MIKLSETQWIDESEEYINSLSKLSAKKVRVVCPACQSERLTSWYSVVRHKTTFCKSCGQVHNKSGLMLGQKFGRLTVVSYADPHVSSRGEKKTCFNAVCECGKQVVVVGARLKSGHTKSCGCISKEMVGEKSPHFNPSLTDEERERNDRKTSFRFRTDVRRRDGWKCVVCDSTDFLVVHHLDGYKNNPELRHDVNNGVTLCKSCHNDFHINFMGGYRVPVTRQDFEDYLEQV